ncbi:MULTISPECIES: hypothetical protein [Acinetobacter]|uniref:hypothetical protein n=1 Tax=Acinetobacter TaxID=469 RepID=UPI0002CDD5F5|nr:MULTISPECIES: hypothetical protein [Acinetobacter]ENV04055.1 hypothetical protein F968_00807 [Acinetobacter sp. NIPH 817]MCU4635188.1 hypothetical protein [Acinetobacter sp. WU_MDCI_Abxa265]RFF25710.1 hypothetical protein DZ985_00320 [Acinetobacter sp. JW]
MSDAEKLQFKLELLLNLKSAKDIQNWAIDRLDKNPADLLALEVCFFSKDNKVLDYFNNISIAETTIEPTLKKKILYEVLKKYTEIIPSIGYSIELISNLFAILIKISRFAEDENLYDFINYYDDELYLALEGISKLEPEEIWPTFLNDLKNWLSL